jgi:hypothetical protein
MLGLNDIILKRKKVRNGVFAYMTQNGVIIEDQIYIGYSFTESIARHRRKFPIYKRKK